LICDTLHDLIWRAIHRFGLDARVDLVIDIIYNDKFIMRERDFCCEPIQFTNGRDTLGDSVSRRASAECDQ
jgi:hypothetical protein